MTERRRRLVHPATVQYEVPEEYAAREDAMPGEPGTVRLPLDGVQRVEGGYRAVLSGDDGRVIWESEKVYQRVDQAQLAAARRRMAMVMAERLVVRHLVLTLDSREESVLEVDHWLTALGAISARVAGWKEKSQLMPGSVILHAPDYSWALFSRAEAREYVNVQVVLHGGAVELPEYEEVE